MVHKKDLFTGVVAWNSSHILVRSHGPLPRVSFWIGLLEQAEKQLEVQATGMTAFWIRIEYSSDGVMKNNCSEIICGFVLILHHNLHVFEKIIKFQKWLFSALDFILVIQWNPIPHKNKVDPKYPDLNSPNLS